MCLLHQITCEVASEIFHFPWLDAAVLKYETKAVVRVKNIIKTTKHPVALIESSIKSASQIPLKELRKPKEKGEEVIPFISTHNLNNCNI